MAKRKQMTVWTKKAERLLVGKTIKQVSYTTTENNKDLGWHESGLVIFLDDGTQIIVQCDDEGNGPGSLEVTKGTKYEILPTIDPEGSC